MTEFVQSPNVNHWLIFLHEGFCRWLRDCVETAKRAERLSAEQSQELHQNFADLVGWLPSSPPKTDRLSKRWRIALKPSNGTKVGAILYGLVAGISLALVIVFSSFLLGILAALVSIHTPRINLGEYPPWLPIIFAECSVVPAFVVGAIICWKIWKSRLRSTE